MLEKNVMCVQPDTQIMLGGFRTRDRGSLRDDQMKKQQEASKSKLQKFYFQANTEVQLDIETHDLRRKKAFVGNVCSTKGYSRQYGF